MDYPRRTTPDFLTHFGLSDRRDLPGIDDLRAAGLLDRVSNDDFVGDLETADEED
jgi:segregation and condensation protein B